MDLASGKSKKNVMIFSPARSGSTLVSLILGAHSQITNFGESHWICEDSASRKRGGGGESDGICIAHGRDCETINNLLGMISYSNHFEEISRATNTDYFLTSNKGKGHYSKTDFQKFQSFPLLIYKPMEVWAGSYLVPSKRKQKKLSEDNSEAISKLSDTFFGYYDKTLSYLEGNEVTSNFFVVDYLRLVSETEAHVSEICDFIGVEFESRMLKFNSYLISNDPDQHPIGGNRRTYSTLNNKDRRYDSDINNIFFERKYLNYLDNREIKRIRGDPRYKELERRLAIVSSASGLIEDS